jgi:hypothetical protein
MTTKFGKRSNKEPNYLGTTEKIELEGHKHNIPNIDFNETGRYIASVSLDTTCKIWDISARQMVTQKRSLGREIIQNSWCWSTKFIKPGNFKHVVCADKEVSRLYQQRVYQGRSTSLSSLGLCHSASNPAFPINVSRVFDLEEEEIDFEIYEGEGEGELDNDMWDNRLLEEEDNYMEEVYERQRMEDDHDYNFNNADAVETTEHNDNVDLDESSDILRPNSQQEIDEDDDGDEDYDEDDYENDIDEDGRMTQLMLSLVSGGEHQRTQEDWAATITDSTDSNHDGWGDALPSAEQSSYSTDNDHGWGAADAVATDVSEIMEIDDNNPETTLSSSNSPSYCIPNIIRTTSNSSIPQLTNTVIVTPKEPTKDETVHKNLGEYVMITTGKDVILASTTLPRMNKIRAEHDMINKVDIRSDQLLSVLNRINMVEWLPELELFVAASQKGTVALMRLLQVEFEDGGQACLFNNEHYLPSNVLQSTPLYGEFYSIFCSNLIFT